MKVKCISNRTIEGDRIYSNITPNKEYIVLAIEFYNVNISLFGKTMGDYAFYRLEDDEGLIKIIPSKLFIITSDKLSKHWVLHTESEEAYSLLPKQWATLSFWEDFYDDEYDAIKKFKIIRDKIYEEENI
ncbi:hypothetical protein [Clostridium intestinale]|uniref:Uncharacterized protein n=1 Tax=Clostridium intestinale DSM 6191 TaxID=1121320 RepID=A0A1M5YF02_9CLOT|nr:hypothetical protein [Clostridium intestinale]SHI10630.1 hypothetical protein SAMN02745941_01944 [Clostridium intestinale DSM 6191]